MSDDIRKELSADLPSPHEEEPSSLREDIFDELTDHLLCAMKREQIREGQNLDQESIWQRVLQRFGNPSQVARQLWFAWMWEKIMMQRFTLLLTCLVVITCGIVVFMMNKSLQSSQQNQALLMQQLAALTKDRSSGPQRSQPTEWNRLQVKVVYEDQSPVANAKVEFMGLGEQTKSIPSSELETDEDGLVDFGLVLYGKYSINVKSGHVGDSMRQIETMNHHVSVHPGQDKLFEVTIPKDPTRKVKLTPRLTSPLPEKIDQARLWYLTVWTSTGSSSRSFSADSNESMWMASSSSSEPINDQHVSAFISEGKALPISKLKSVDFKERFDGLVAEEDQPIHRFAAMRYLIPEQVKAEDSVDFPLGGYQAVHTEPYVEIKLNDGRTILSQIPDLSIPILVATNVANKNMKARE